MFNEKNTMRIQVCCLALILSAAPLLASAQQTTTSTPADAVMTTMRAIRAADASGDAETWNRLVAPDCSFIEPNGAIEKRAAHVPQAGRRDTGVGGTSELSDIRVHDHGDVAIVTYREDLSVTIGDNTTRSATRYAETYKRSAENWFMVFSVETPILLPAIIKVVPAVFDDYTGDYQVAPNVVGTVYRDGARLMLKGTGWSHPYELLPIAADTFVVKGMEQNEITFVRDAKGKVTHQSSKFRGQQQAMAKKIK